jgi:hypothetical protein
MELMNLRKLWCMLDNAWGLTVNELDETYGIDNLIDDSRVFVAQQISNVYDEQGYVKFVETEIDPYITWLPKERNWLIIK